MPSSVRSAVYFRERYANDSDFREKRKARARQQTKDIAADPTRKAKERQRNLGRAHTRREKISAIKLASGCVDCGYNKHAVALDFDHRQEEEKLFNIGMEPNRRWSDIEAEIAKCDVRCANCHRVSWGVNG